MRYCAKCLYPEIKPDLVIDEDGMCSACNSFTARRDIDWKAREKLFINLCAKTQEATISSGRIYDCLIPVSGGKDSHYQVITALKYGLKPLVVNARTDSISDIGRRNLDNIGNLGVDVIEVSTNPKLRRKINKYTFTTIGDISWAEHITIFTIPYIIAWQYDIKLVIWGENPQNEYGGPEQDLEYMKPSWLQEFGGLNGLRVIDLIDQGIVLEPGELCHYMMPEKDKLAHGVFLGYYFPWDGRKNAEIAMEHGFETYKRGVEGTGVVYENLDNYQTGIHDYFKWLKFGFGRATDIACNHIRRGYITRDEGKEFVLFHDGKFPSTYLGRSLESILAEIDMSIDEFMAVCDKFTNTALFEPRGKMSPRPKLKHNIMEV